MIPLNVEFDVDYNGKPIHIKSRDTGKGVIYVATYPGAKDLYIHRATNAQGDLFWTSIPEGRQPAAEHIGKMIEEYFHDHEND